MYTHEGRPPSSAAPMRPSSCSQLLCIVRSTLRREAIWASMPSAAATSLARTRSISKPTADAALRRPVVHHCSRCSIDCIVAFSSLCKTSTCPPRLRFASRFCARVARSGSGRPRTTRAPCASGACGARAKAAPGTASCITRSTGSAAVPKVIGRNRRTWLAGALRRPATICRSPLLRLRSIAPGCGAGRPGSCGWSGRTSCGGAATTMRASAPALAGP